MSYLNKYLEEKNRFQFWMGKPVLDPKSDRDQIKQMIECDLSPENLYMDGEASDEYARERYELLIGALRQLNGEQ